MTPAELSELIANAVESKLAHLSPDTSDNDTLLTRDEACKFLSINSSTLWKYTNQGKLIAHAVGGRRYYKKGLLLEALSQVKVKR